MQNYEKRLRRLKRVIKDLVHVSIVLMFTVQIMN